MGRVSTCITIALLTSVMSVCAEEPTKTEEILGHSGPSTKPDNSRQVKKDSKLSHEKTTAGKSQIEAYLSSQWSKDRIRKFCIPATRHLPVLQQLVPSTDNVVKGTLYSYSKELGRVAWYGCLKDETGEPLSFQLSVTKPGDHQYWVLDILGESRPEIRFGKDEFNKYVVETILRNCEIGYIHAHYRGDTIPKDFRQIMIDKILSVASDESGRATRFSARLKNGQLLTASLDPDMSMTNILVDGKPNHYWMTLSAELVKNVDYVYRMFE